MSHVVNRLNAFGRTLPVLLALVCPAVNARQTQPPAPTPAPDLVAHLLELPSPPPPSVWPRLEPEEPPDKWMTASGVPSDEAPPGVLLDFWWARQKVEDGLKPSEAVRKKLLQAVEKELDRLPYMHEFLPNDVAENAVDDLPPVNVRGFSHTRQYQYVHLTRDGGRRVFMDTPFGMEKGRSVYERLGLHFYQLSGTKAQ